MTHSQARGRVLLIDDEPLVAQAAERLLHNDFDVTLALSAQEALEHFVKGTRFDAIVSDVMMPTMTGLELADELQRIAPDQAQRLIFITGGAFSVEIRDQLDKLGAPQIGKPFTGMELRDCVCLVIEKRHSS